VAILLATFGFAGRIHVRLSDPETLPIMVNASAMLFFIYTRSSSFFRLTGSVKMKLCPQRSRRHFRHPAAVH
jgi:hypothetical protein